MLEINFLSRSLPTSARRINNLLARIAVTLSKGKKLILRCVDCNAFTLNDVIGEKDWKYGNSGIAFIQRVERYLKPEIKRKILELFESTLCPDCSKKEKSEIFRQAINNYFEGLKTIDKKEGR